MRIGLASIFLILYSCQTSSTTTDVNGPYEPNRSVKKFINGFEKAVMTHESGAIMEYLHEDYVKEQHDQFLEERTDQFLNELFCGNKIDAKGFACIEYTSITSIQYFKAERKNGIKWIFFEVSNKDTKVLMDLSIKASKSKLKYGFVGAYG